ncbi:MAG: TIGR03936 family radical SAM-associated protein [Lachnospiraceae bacterium]|nr:TIGR03936 family radical SAM-associated protein [Lachnospiraceae bacterium]
MTKIRIRFTKHGAVRYIGHLDVMRYFQKTIRRAGINVSYSGGYSPHQIMTFAAPLGVGLESDGEYMDLGIEDEKPDLAMIKDSLNASSVPGIRILSVKKLPEDAGNAMASVYASSYEISFYDDKKDQCPDKDLMKELISRSQTLDTMIYHKETKKTSRDIDLKQFIYELYIKEDENDKPYICMTINSSSSDSIKPGFVMEYLCGLEDIKLPDNSLQITRLDMFTLGENGELISMDDIGSDE